MPVGSVWSNLNDPFSKLKQVRHNCQKVKYGNAECNTTTMQRDLDRDLDPMRTTMRPWRLWRLCGRRRGGQLIIAVVIMVTTMFILSSVTQQTKEGTPIFVVEEHHEVIPYWFQAAEDGLIQKQGNTLIHIDGHSDDSLPTYEGKTFFRWPVDDDDLERMMQKNDIFIQAAAMTGLISRFVFIWPMWDTSNDLEVSYVFATDLGMMTDTAPRAGQKTPQYCTCRRRKGKTDCDGEEDGDDWTSTRSCDVRKTYTTEYIVDNHALYRLVTQQGAVWPQVEGSVILDIDEDYFGCELGATPLLEAEVEWAPVKVVSKRVEDLFCPTRIVHESETNTLLRAVFAAVIDACRPVETPTGACPLTPVQVLALMKPLVRDFTLRWPTVVCPDPRSRWHHLAAAMLRLRRRDLVAVRDLGFCLSQTPASYEGNRGAVSILVCHGANTPNETLVFAHTPTADEVRSRMAGLAIILRALDGGRTPPAIVTLCRSVRDGYTPREQFVTIEAGILDIFSRQLTNRTRYDVFYDDNLLGGKGGWPHRHDTMTPTHGSKWHSL